MISKKALLPALALLLASCAGHKQVPAVSADTLPMYGRTERPVLLQKADSDFVKAATLDRSRDSASRYFAGVGWEMFLQKDYEAAMKRFNEAWLLDSTNGSVYWGFGNIYNARNKPSDSTFYFYNLARKYLPENDRFEADVALAYGAEARRRKAHGDVKWRAYHEKAVSTFSSLKTRLREDCDLFLNYWEYALEFSDVPHVLAAKGVVDSIGITRPNLSRLIDLKEKTESKGIR